MMAGGARSHPGGTCEPTQQVPLYKVVQALTEDPTGPHRPGCNYTIWPRRKEEPEVPLE